MKATADRARAMGESGQRLTGGCLCGALRYEARGEPQYAGLCYCSDCCKASGSAFIAFMGFPSSTVTFAGETRQFRSKSARGGDAVRNFCAVCGSLVFGGIVGQDLSHTVYAGSLDDLSRFQPKMAIFAANRPVWCVVPPGLTVFERMPGG